MSEVRHKFSVNFARNVFDKIIQNKDKENNIINGTSVFCKALFLSTDESDGDFETDDSESTRDSSSVTQPKRHRVFMAKQKRNVQKGKSSVQGDVAGVDGDSASNNATDVIFKTFKTVRYKPKDDVMVLTCYDRPEGLEEDKTLIDNAVAGAVGAPWRQD